MDGLNSQVSWGLGWPPLEMYIWSVYTNIFTKQSGPFNSEENSIRGSFAVSEFGERIGKILIVLLGCKIFEVRMPQTTQRFHSVSDSFHSRIDVWGWMMWPLWLEPEVHKVHIMKIPTSIHEWTRQKGLQGNSGPMILYLSCRFLRAELSGWSRITISYTKENNEWFLVIQTSKISQPCRAIRILPMLSPKSETGKETQSVFSYALNVILFWAQTFA